MSQQTGVNGGYLVCYDFLMLFLIAIPCIAVAKAMTILHTVFNIYYEHQKPKQGLGIRREVVN